MLGKSQGYQTAFWLPPLRVAGLLLLALLLGGADWDTIQKRGYLRVGVKENTRPLGFRDDRGELQGLEIDLARQLAQELLDNPNALELVPLLNQERLPALFADRVDLVIAQMGVNPARARVAEFSPYYYLDGAGVIIAKESGLNSLSVQTGRLGVLQSSSAVPLLKRRFPRATLIGLPSYAEARRALTQRRIDAFAGDLSVLTGWAQTDSQLEKLPVQWSDSALGVAMPRGLQYETLREKVNWAITRLRASGWLRRRGAAWGLYPFEP
ncbi:MAG: transporter substrate-binding domain-containing protein [Cyanobacteriota bacterium]|jgi:polar amino acid transport system substrate-binding protein